MESEDKINIPFFVSDLEPWRWCNGHQMQTLNYLFKKCYSSSVLNMSQRVCRLIHSSHCLKHTRGCFLRAQPIFYRNNIFCLLCVVRLCSPSHCSCTVYKSQERLSSQWSAFDFIHLWRQMWFGHYVYIVFFCFICMHSSSCLTCVCGLHLLVMSVPGFCGFCRQTFTEENTQVIFHQIVSLQVYYCILKTMYW